LYQAAFSEKKRVEHLHLQLTLSYIWVGAK
jgi:hypothetical protein